MPAKQADQNERAIHVKKNHSTTSVDNSVQHPRGNHSKPYLAGPATRCLPNRQVEQVEFFKQKIENA
jgi:hypothetical protein